jgi:hypothetical protein
MPSVKTLFVSSSSGFRRCPSLSSVQPDISVKVSTDIVVASERPRKNPTALAVGLEFLFFSKEVTANSITGDSVFILLLLDLDLIIIIIFLLASKSCL